MNNTGYMFKLDVAKRNAEVAVSESGSRGETALQSLAKSHLNLVEALIEKETKDA